MLNDHVVPFGRKAGTDGPIPFEELPKGLIPGAKSQRLSNTSFARKWPILQYYEKFTTSSMPLSVLERIPP